MAVADNTLADRFGTVTTGRETLTVRLPGDVARAIRVWQAQHLYLTGEQVSRSDALEYLIWRGLQAAASGRTWLDTVELAFVVGDGKPARGILNYKGADEPRRKKRDKEPEGHPA